MMTAIIKKSRGFRSEELHDSPTRRAAIPGVETVKAAYLLLIEGAGNYQDDDDRDNQKVKRIPFCSGRPGDRGCALLARHTVSPSNERLTLFVPPMAHGNPESPPFRGETSVSPTASLPGAGTVAAPPAHRSCGQHPFRPQVPGTGLKVSPSPAPVR